MNKPLISFFVIILSISFAFFYVRPTYSLTQERRASLASFAKIADDAKGIEKLIDDTDKNLNSVKPSDLARFDVFLPARLDPIRFANNLQRMGLAVGIVLEDIKVGEHSQSVGVKNVEEDSVSRFAIGGAIKQADEVKDAKEKKYVTTKASFSFITTYEKFALFLNDIQESLALLDIKEMKFNQIQESTDTTKGSKTAGPLTYQFNLTIETYSLK